MKRMSLLGKVRVPVGLPAQLGAVFSLEQETFFLRTTTGAWAAAELGLINRIDNRTNIFTWDRSHWAGDACVDRLVALA